jgi:amino acid adenylation domain-containing protein
MSIMQSNASVSRLFEDQVKRTPDEVALVHGSVQWTYHALNARANQFGRYLRRHGVSPETRVAVCVERSFDLIAVLLGVAKAGGAYVPLEPTFPPARVADVLATAKASLLVTSHRRPELEIFEGEMIVIAEHEDRIRCEDTVDFDGGADPENVFAVLFTSGTTGTPKGILMRTAGVVSLITGMNTQFPFQQGDTFLLHRSFTIVGSIWEYFGPLLHGMRSTILSGDDSRDPTTIWKHLIEDKVTHIILSPTLGDAIIKHGERYALESNSLRFGVIGGEPVSKRTIAGWLRQFPSDKLFVCYGITETMYVAFFDTSLLDPNDERVPVGAQFIRATVRILNDAMECVDEGCVGEICVSSSCLSRGYLNDPRATAERFIANFWASAPGSRLYRTGDLGCWRLDGKLEVRGRCDRQAKIRGFRVELDEVEAVVRRISKARNVAVLAPSDADGRQQLIAYLETDTAIAADDLRRELRRVVPDHMVPSRFVPVALIPVNVGGKLDRAALAEPPLQRGATKKSVLGGEYQKTDSRRTRAIDSGL